LARLGFAVALTIAVQLFYGALPATATPPSTKATAPGHTSNSTGSTARAPAEPDCNDVLAGNQTAPLSKTVVGGDEQLGFELFRIETGRPAGVFHVVDCIRAVQDSPNPPVISTVDLGEVQITGSSTFRLDIPTSAVPGEEVCDRFVVSGLVQGEPFTDVSNEVCQIFSSCLFFGPGTCPPGAESPPTTGAVAPTGPRGGSLPFTGSTTWPLLLTAVALLGLGIASVVVARRSS
jgi:hypothetical protein